jgi:hypothetical protein
LTGEALKSPAQPAFCRLCDAQRGCDYRDRALIRLVAIALRSGHLAVAEFRIHRIKALVRADNGHEAYLAIITQGVPTRRCSRCLCSRCGTRRLAAGIVAPGGDDSGEIIWSTLFTSEVAYEILDQDRDD